MSNIMKRTELTLEQVHDKELKILEYFIEVCNKNNLQYFLVYGSLLGAVRHKGFIPWDDDIDVGMMRKDYDALATILRNSNDKLFFWQDDISEPSYPLSFGKIRLNNTYVYEEDFQHLNVHQGLFIDVYPFDYCADNDFIVAILNKLVQVISMSLLFKSARPYKRKLPHLYSQLICEMTSCLPYSIIKSLRRIVIWVSRRLSSKKRLSFIGGNVFPRGVYLLDWFKRFKTVPFEGLNAQIPEEWDAILKTTYGDYMTLPSLNCRLRHFPKAEVIN